MRRAGGTEREAASVRAHDLAPETGTTSTASPGSNMGKRGTIKATGTGAAVALPRGPRTRRRVDTDEGGQMTNEIYR